MGFGEDEESVDQPTSSTSTLSFTTTTTSTRAFPLSPTPSSESEQDCSGGQGAIMMSYPPSGRKGSYISLFWSIFNMGGVIGGFITFILNYNRSEAASVNDGTYIGFMCFMSVSIVLTLVILHLSCVVRDDDNHYTNIKYFDVSTEAVEILKLFWNWKMLLMVPAAWASTRPRPASRGTGMGSY